MSGEGSADGVWEALSRSLFDVSVPRPRSTILDSPVTEQDFLEQLHELNNKINFAKELSFRETLACSDIQDIVDRLKLKVRDGATGEGLGTLMWSFTVSPTIPSLLPSGRVKDPRVHPSEDLLLQEAHDQLPDPSEHSAEVQVGGDKRTERKRGVVLIQMCSFAYRNLNIPWRGFRISFSGC